jgi:membrane protein CcdC involved in cytochrome C biogenesis
MDISTVMDFKAGAFFFFLAFFVVVFWRVATRNEGFYRHDATIVLDKDTVTESHQGVPHE